MCKDQVWNDGVVPVQSAVWKIKDNARSKSLHTDLTGTADFSSFVKPRLAIGPKGNHNPEAPDVTELPGSTGAFTNSIQQGDAFARAIMPRVYGVRYVAAENEIPNSPIQPFAQAVKLAGKQITEIELPVETAANFGITFMAIADVSVTLLDNDNMTVGKCLANTPEANQWFRSLFVDKPVTAGRWKLRLENIAEREAEVILTTWSNATR
jgi:hypothetical protein